jgi:hypothetical protein
MIPIPSAPVIVVCLAIVAALRSGKKGITPERQVAFETAMHKCKDPDKLRKLAETFDKEGLKDPYGDMLRKRATLRALPEDVKKARRDAFHKAMKTTDASKIPVLNRMADAYEEEGCTGVAYQLREYAKGLKGQPSVPNTPEPEPVAAPKIVPVAPKEVVEETPEVIAEVVH